VAKISSKKTGENNKPKSSSLKAYIGYTPVVHTVSTELAKGTISVGEYNKTITNVVKSSS
jgi:hypothetical protein